MSNNIRVPLKDWRIALKPEVIAANEDVFPAVFADEVKRGQTHFTVSKKDVRPDYLRSAQ